MFETLHVFDFDGTLFNNPTDTPENQRKYEKATGLPWIITKDMTHALSKKFKKPIYPRRGWHGRPETLEPPLVPDPAPLEWLLPTAKEDFQKSKEDETACTIIMTGRHAGLQKQVLRILYDYKLIQIQKIVDKKGQTFFENKDCIPVHLLGHDGPVSNDVFDKPKPNQTFPWKCWMIEQYLLLYPSIKKTKIWEDREEHVIAFKKFGEQNNFDFEIIHV